MNVVNGLALIVLLLCVATLWRGWTLGRRGGAMGAVRLGFAFCLAAVLALIAVLLALVSLIGAP